MLCFFDEFLFHDIHFEWWIINNDVARKCLNCKIPKIVKFNSNYYIISINFSLIFFTFVSINITESKCVLHFDEFLPIYNVNYIYYILFILDNFQWLMSQRVSSIALQRFDLFLQKFEGAVFSAWYFPPVVHHNHCCRR